jgi:hypothetical protein
MEVYMKKLLRRYLLISAMVFGLVLCVSSQEVEASVVGQIPLQVVDDIDNTPYPKMANVDYYHYTYINRTEFTIDSPGEVRAIFREDIRAKSIGSVWISTDIYGKDIIGKIGYFTGEETLISWFLEKGTYYMFSSYGDMLTENNFNQGNYTSVSVALLFEKSRTQESKTTTSFVSSHSIKLNETFRGFLSTISPSDYYSFTLSKRANVTIGYSFDASNPLDERIGYCTLYDSNELYLAEASYLPTDRGQKTLTYMLEPGSYYVRLNGILGNTTLNISPMYYDVELTKSEEKAWTTEPMDINIDTSIDYSEIVVLFRDVKKSLINRDSYWSSENKAYIPLDGETFTAEDSGVYSIRITDLQGNNTMKKIEVTNIDITEPEIEGVEDGLSYNKPVTITWSDDQSGIDNKKTKLNGKRVKTGIEVKDEGKYVLEVYDKLGNGREIEFNIDYTAPTTNIKNKKTYNDIVIAQINDNVSGVKRLVVNNIEQAVVSPTLYFYLDGEYVLEIWDNADNYRKLEFKIKK